MAVLLPTRTVVLHLYPLLSITWFFPVCFIQQWTENTNYWIIWPCLRESQTRTCMCNLQQCHSFGGGNHDSQRIHFNGILDHTCILCVAYSSFPVPGKAVWGRGVPCPPCPPALEVATSGVPASLRLVPSLGALRAERSNWPQAIAQIPLRNSRKIEHLLVVPRAGVSLEAQASLMFNKSL